MPGGNVDAHPFRSGVKAFADRFDLTIKVILTKYLNQLLTKHMPATIRQLGWADQQIPGTSFQQPIEIDTTSFSPIAYLACLSIWFFSRSLIRDPKPKDAVEGVEGIF